MLFFPLSFYNVIKNMSKRKKKRDTLLWKKREEKSKQCYNNDICRWKRDSFPVNCLNKDIEKREF